MNTETLPKPAESGIDSPQLVHAVCRGCFPGPASPDDIALCGTKPSSLAYHHAPPPDRPWCAVCMELCPKRCERCGR